MEWIEQKAKQLAAQEHTTLTRLIEEGLAARLRTAGTVPTAARPIRLPVHAGRGGLQAGIRDAKSHQAMLDAIDDTDPDR